MRYAVISDIHGNLLALDAVLADVQREGVDEYLFLGDYYADFPYPNEVAKRIWSIPNARVIRGNKEDYLLDLKKQDPATWTADQLAGLYYNYRIMEPDVLSYYLHLPAIDWFDTPAGPVVMAHAAHQLFKGLSVTGWSSSQFANRMREKPFIRAEYLADIDRTLNADEDLRGRLDLSKGTIYLFGDSHVQWHAKAHGAVFLNPGACGLPLDCAVGAPYSILEIDENGKVSIEEKRIVYDLERTARELREWAAYAKAPVWFDVILRELEVPYDHIHAFFGLTEEIAKGMHWPGGYPYSNEIWSQAGRVWRERMWAEEKA